MIIKLGVDAGVVHGVEIDTAFFDGNHAEAVTVQGCFATGEGADEKVIGNKAEDWMNILDKRGCEANRRQAWKVKPSQVVTHVRLCMYPDGGIARFRLYGEVVPEFPGDKGVEVELSALEMGGRCTSCSDEHFGAMGNLVLPGRGMDMGDGWETRRSRGAEHEDWVIVKLGAKGYVDRLVLDTKHFLGNFPKAARVHAIDVGEYGDTYMKSGSDRWVEIMKERGLRPDQEVEVQNKDLINVQGMQYTHIKLTIVPDGGIKRFRVYGRRI